MAGQDSNPEVSISKALRQLKVGYSSIRHEKRATGMATYYSRCPSISLKGNWLEEAGFETGQPVKVTVERGQLIIRLAEE